MRTHCCWSRRPLRAIADVGLLAALRLQRARFPTSRVVRYMGLEHTHDCRSDLIPSIYKIIEAR